MSARFNTLYSLSNNLYLEGFPLVISAGKLLFDTQTGKALAQLKIKNISIKKISALKIKVSCFDVAKHKIGETYFTYLDLDAAPNVEFGQKSPVYLPYSETRSFEVAFIEAVYSDGEIITAPQGDLSAIPSPESTLVFGAELAQEYSLIHGEKCKFIPKKYKNIWVCACGAISSNQFDTCYECGGKFEELVSDANADFLSEHRAKEEESRKNNIYNKACNSSDLSEKIKLYESIAGYKDADNLAEKARQQKETNTKRNKKITIISTSIVCVLIAFWSLWVNVIMPNTEYNKALDLMNAGKYEEAILAFEAMDGYKDSIAKIEESKVAILDEKYNDAIALMEAEKYEEAIAAFEAMEGYKDSVDKIAECETVFHDNKYNEAVALLNSGNKLAALKEFQKCSSYKDSYNHIKNLIDGSNAFEILSAGEDHTIGLKSDGTVVAVGDNDWGQCNVGGWKDIVAVSTGDWHTIGLKSDGTVVAVGNNNCGQCNVEGWKDIVAVSAGNYHHTVGLKSDSTVVAVGENYHGQCNVKDWKDIVAVSAGYYHTVGLKSDGTVVAVGDKKYGQCNVEGWKDIVAVSAGDSHTIGLKSDGTVVAVGVNNCGQCNVEGWKDIVAVSAGVFHTIGLKSDGTVVAVGNNDYGRCDVEDWKDIVAVSASYSHTVGLKSDGTVVAVGNNDYGRCDVENWPKLGIKFE